MVTDSDGKADTPKGQADWKKERQTVLSPKSPTPGVMRLPIPGASPARPRVVRVTPRTGVLGASSLAGGVFADGPDTLNRRNTLLRPVP
ncbi:hypothetical protein GCM10010116_05810 [Microbispora rosea subsp. aerata]|nr:hypothetical protein GCM10010116_05810 [Microbispora rosea subsp. aerata]GIH54518.1 hypothetical protein Mro02_14320 [Microbispora rosea subsp. aerata]GLJ82784.1 hypothetical protein GCM10017588_15100 [Microbispora rosea subsp. aerata]